VYLLEKVAVAAALRALLLSHAPSSWICCEEAHKMMTCTW